MPNNEAPLSVTMKPHTGYDAPLLTIRADTPQELETRLAAIEQGGILDAVGRISASFAAKYELGKQLGARTEGDPVAAAPPQQQPPAQQETPSPWGDPAANPANQWGGQAQPAPVQQQPQAAAYAPPAAAAPAAMPGAPTVLGMPAKMITGTSAKGPWRAWADPRDRSATQHITEKTDDPFDPRLAQGTAKFWAWIR